MYHFSYFKEKDRKVIFELIEKFPFAFLTGSLKSGKQVATQVPILFEERNDELYLQGHIMRNTDHHKAFIENQNVLAVFTGPSAYVSASWYSNPQIGSTYNYMSVHVNGRMRFMSDAELIEFMRKFTLKFEKGNPLSPTIYDNLPVSFIDKMLPAIVGFGIKTETLDNVFKLSQNRDKESFENIIRNLEDIGGNSALVALEMKKRISELFPTGAVYDPSKFDS